MVVNMIYVFLIVGIMFLIWLLIYWKNKNAKYALPYLILAFVTPFYELLDKIFFVKIFGCGCVPSTQQNMFHNSFNANDLRITVYFVLAVFLFWYSCKLSKNFKRKDMKIAYVISNIIINIIIIYFINKIFMWM